MTKITFSDKDGKYYIKAEGHATGSPTVCAAISGIMYALAGWLYNAETVGRADPGTPQIVFGDGLSALEFEGGDEAKAVYEMAVIGLMQIAKAEPEYVEVEKDSSM